MYRYTKNNKYISNELRDFYEENGFIVFRDLVDHGVLDICKQRFIDYCNGTAVDPAFVTLMKDAELRSQNAKGERLINKLQDFAADDILFKYISYEPMVNIVESIIGPNITACHSMFINKPPDSHEDMSAHPMHQDLHYFPFRPADAIVASWTAIEHIDERNGCLFVIPGSHKAGQLYTHDYSKSAGVRNKPLYHEVNGVSDSKKTNLIMDIGDTVFFHPLLVHGSGPNLTKGFRKAISCHYADTNCNFIDVRGTTQEKLGKEITELAMKLYNADLSFIEVWKAKGRLVRGMPGNFQNVASKL